MPFLSVLLLGTVAATASASMLNPGFEIELPETIPAGPIYDEQTTVLVEAYCPGCFGDLDGDEVVTDEDFRLWVIAHMADRIEIIDVNSDGRLNVIDEVESVARFLDLLSGDLNADGQVNQQDLDLFMARYSNYSNDDLLYFNRNNPDMNLDGQVTQNDIDLFLARMVNPTVPDRVEVAVDILANTIGTLTHGFYSNGHIMQTSATWPSHSGSTSRGVPSWVPPNHTYTMSMHWLPHTAQTSSYGNPSHGTNNSRHWPATHLAEISNQWYPGHNNAVSTLSPPNHSIAISTTWHQSPTGHDSTVSYLWPPDHAVNLSQAMHPAQHAQSYSTIRDLEAFPLEGYPEWPTMIPLWSPHLESWSGTWPAEHVTTISEVFFPPNHMGSTSASWITHQVNFSARWPTNHLMAVSTQWPSQTPAQVPNWPPNHGLPVSQSWPEPIQPAPPPFTLPPLFPPGHSIYTTVQELIPFLQAP